MILRPHRIVSIYYTKTSLSEWNDLQFQTCRRNGPDRKTISFPVKQTCQMSSLYHMLRFLCLLCGARFTFKWQTPRNDTSWRTNKREFFRIFGNWFCSLLFRCQIPAIRDPVSTSRESRCWRKLKETRFVAEISYCDCCFFAM